MNILSNMVVKYRKNPKEVEEWELKEIIARVLTLHQPMHLKIN